MEQICGAVEPLFPCREASIRTLCELIGHCNEAYPPAIYIFGHSGTGKTSLTKAILQQCERQQKVRTVQLNAIECYTTKILLENVLDALAPEEQQPAESLVADNMLEFVEQLRRWHGKSARGFLIAVDNAERLRDMDANVLPVLLRLQQLTGLNICVLLLSQLPFEKYYNKTGLSEIIPVHLAQYNKTETLRILSSDFDQLKRQLQLQLDGDRLAICEQSLTPEFYSNYLNLFLSVFYKACRDVPELRLTARKCFAVYMEPVLDGSVECTDVSRLWRHIAGPLRSALTQIYLRVEKPLGEPDIEDQSVRRLAQSLELPYYGKFLLIAAFLASHNSAKQDKRLFVKHHGKQRKRMQTVNARAKNAEKMSTTLGPKSFSIDRLLAIFYAILDEKVGLTCNLLSQISTLVHLKLLAFVSGEQNIMDGSAKLQCTVGLEFVLYIGKVVGFNVRQYLCDFM
ncbi:origin recognition complex subunit 5 [Drosophila grimshawi]|uniref:Origin recognition complex subunit 5 n=1 Tax=Drosophila grimshawi TaxID=7222 RepID=B4JCX6_DROGR|nr:origin recognition complex subunit 5 [Drosophila grimshawi]EDW03215.1 GH11118 [Drosophila grimshawi]